MNMKKIIAGVFACCIVGGVMPNVADVSGDTLTTASAVDEAEYTEGEYETLKYKNYGDHIEISKFDWSATEVVIPAEIDGVPVTSIGERAFINSDVKSVTIPDGVTSIGESAFDCCNYLASVTIPDSVTSIGKKAFNSCHRLTSVTIPNGVTSIENNTFYGCNSLTEITIPESVTSIGDSAFWNCNGLTSVTISANSVTIGEYAFSNCSKLESIEASGNITDIKTGAFSGTPWLKTTSEEKNTIIGGYLYQTKVRTGDVVIPDGVKIIGESVFSEANNLKSITLPDGITKIGNNAFNKCTSLESIILPDGITKIGNNAFNKCTSLTSIALPDGVAVIGGGAFYGCTNLTSITLPDSITVIGNDVFSETPWLEAKRAENPLVIVSSIVVDGRTCADDVVVPDYITGISPDAFLGCSKLTSITIPESVENIGADAFKNCSALKSVTILNPECIIYGTANTISNSSGFFSGTKYTGVIYGYENSTAQKYAYDYDKDFGSLGEAPETPVETTTTTNATTVPTTTTAGNIKVKLLGDANEDETVDIADATAIIQHIGNKDKYALSEQGSANADCYNTGDGITGMDAVAIQKLEAKIINSLPLTE